MRLSVELRYPAPIDDVGDALTTEEFWRWRAGSTAQEVERLDVGGHPGGGSAVTMWSSLAHESLPAPLRGVVATRPQTRRTEVWDPRTGDARTGTVALDITGTPVRLSGRMTLRALDGGCLHAYDGELTAAVPLFGARVEAAVAEAVRDILAHEESAGMRWFARKG